MGADNTPTTDLSQTHLRTTHVIAIFVAIVGAGLAIGRAYMGVTWEVRDLSNAQKEIPTKKDLQTMHDDLSLELSKAAGERVKFYMESAKLECDTVRGRKANCHLIWPAPSN